MVDYGNNAAGAAQREKGANSLSRNQAIVFDALKRDGNPMKAYALLERVKDEGVRAPMTVYRALSDLMEMGLVYKLDSTKAYSVTSSAASDIPVFLVCDTCGNSRMIGSEQLEEAARDSALQNGFSLDRLRIEVTGYCCSKSA
ncbi:Fur family transcriptional regulator [Aquisalinus flavus]|uniref:Transcriptional repressor n=1 Tax=Aquisalinus flavus TaxID=1526572 RepID=A0A8J2V2K1_9PROT|nr:transcriptional repressor [Aquisalinus flavus]MBD0427826.1 transcriptional repressor [Aquisalinus flavus]UNE47594.1 transcriptional repressor [Aquisalinus flavus]GGD04142.1 transcriptional repressor [Aquisalinus flavus]